MKYLRKFWPWRVIEEQREIIAARGKTIHRLELRMRKRNRKVAYLHKITWRSKENWEARKAQKAVAPLGGTTTERTVVGV